MNTVAVSQPNSFTTAPQGDPPAFATATIRDPAGRTLRLTGCDAGTTNFLCDQVAHLRFVQTAMDPGQQWFVDFQVRSRSADCSRKGRGAGVGWKRTLQPRPTTRTGRTAASITRSLRSNSYDGDGSDPSLIGRKVGTVTANGSAIDRWNRQHRYRGRSLHL